MSQESEHSIATDVDVSSLQQSNTDVTPDDKGLALLDAERYDEALAYYEARLVEEPENAAYWRGKAQALDYLTRADEALAAIEQAMEVEPDDLGNWNSKGCILGTLQQWDEADACFDHALELDATFDKAWGNKGWLRIQQELFEESLACSERALALNPDEATYLHNKAYALFSMGRLDEALSAFDAVLALAPSAPSLHADAYENRGWVLYNLNAVAHAEEILTMSERAIALKPMASPWYLKGRALSELERYDEALTAYEQALTLDPAFADAWDQKAWTLRQLERFDEALAASDVSLQLHDDNAFAWYSKGEALAYLNRFDEALACYERAIVLAPDGEVGEAAQEQKAWVLSELGRHEESLAMADSALQHDDSDAYWWYRKAYALDDLERYDESLASSEKSLELDDTQARIWNLKGHALIALHRYDEALVAYDRAIHLDETDVVAWRCKAGLLVEQGRTQEAFTALLHVLRLSSDSPTVKKAQIVAELGALAAAGQRQQALEIVDEALRLDPDDADLWLLKGSLLRELDRPDEALAHDVEALTRFPGHAHLWLEKAITLRQAKQYEEALIAIEEALRIDDSAPVAWWQKGHIYRAAQREQEALPCFARALALQPTYAAAAHDYAASLGRLGRNEESLLAYDRAIELAPEDARLWRWKGITLCRLGRPDEAIAPYQRAIEIAPTDAELPRELGDILYGQTRYDEAVAAYGEALRLNQSNPLAWRGKAHALNELDRYDESLDCCKYALALNPTDAGALQLKTYALFKLKRYDEGLATIAATLALAVERKEYLKPAQHSWLLRLKAATLRDQHHEDEALATYDQVLALDSSDAIAWTNKILLLNTIGRYEDGLACAEMAVERLPDNEDLRRLRDQTAACIRRSTPDQRMQLHDGRWLGYTDYGDPAGAPVFLCHGLPGSRLDALGMDELLARLHVRLITPDRPGLGLSDFKPRRRILDWPDDLVELADHLGIERFAVLGISGGGPYAAACAYKIPQRLTKVGLVSSSAFGEAPHGRKGLRLINRYSFWIARLAPWPLLRLMGQFTAAIAMTKLDPQTRYDMTKRFVSLPDATALGSAKLSPVAVEAANEPYKQGGTGYAWDMRLAAHRWRFRLQDIHADVYLWHGEQDVLSPIAVGRYLADTIPNCHATFYPDAGHFLLTTHWQDVLTTLTSS